MQRGTSCQTIGPTCQTPPAEGQPPWPTLLESIASVTACHAGQEIVGERDSADGWYCVISGAARRCAVRSDGKRQIVDLLLPGDFFGFTPRDCQVSTIEAIADGTVVAYYPRQQLYLLAESDPRVARQVCELSLDAIARLHEHILVLGRTTTRGKVASFILRLAERLSGNTATRLVLPMSRYDIADYLAISVETVSRSLTGLRQSGAIALSGARRVKINDREALEEGDRDEEPLAVRQARDEFSHGIDHQHASTRAEPAGFPGSAFQATGNPHPAMRSISQQPLRKPHTE